MTWPELVGHIERELAASPADFLREKWISKTMHPSSRPLSHKYVKALRPSKYWRRTLYPAGCDPEFGQPFRFELDQRISPQSLQHTFYLNLLHERFGLEMPSVGHIVEIGGGYGNLARIIRGLGHTGRYQIADLPEVHALQRHYLDHVSPGHGIEFISTDEIEGGDLLIATFSVSEMPMELRDQLEQKYARFRWLLFGTTRDFPALGVDNVSYFQGLSDRIGGEFFKDPHRSAWFVMCRR